MVAERFEVPPEMLNNKCDPDDLDFETTQELPTLEEMIGQERAFSAIELALDMQEPGFNLFISGPRRVLEETPLLGHT